MQSVLEVQVDYSHYYPYTRLLQEVQMLFKHVLDEQSELLEHVASSHSKVESHETQIEFTHVFNKQSESIVHVAPSQ
jgi:hypothetical protein